MKRSLGALICLSLLASLVSSPAFSAVKNGSKCSKVGAKQIVGTKTFICTKAGKKIVWKVATTAIQPKPISTPTPIPSSSSTPDPTPSETPSPIASPTKVLKTWEQLRQKVNIQLADRMKTESDFDIEFIMSPTVNREKAEETAKAYREAGRYWTKFYGAKGSYPIIWVLLSENDYDWWRAKVLELEGGRASYPWDPATNIFGHCRLTPKAFCGYGTTQIGASGKQTLYQYNVIGSQFTDKPVPNVVHHESVHFYQLSNNQTFPNDLPCWYVEGQATYYGNSLSMSNDRDWEYQWVVNTVPDARKKSAAEWHQYLEQLQRNTEECRKDRKNYSIGSILWEYLLLNYSEESLHKVLVFMKDRTWSQATEQILGISSSDLSLKLADYIAEVGRT